MNNSKTTIYTYDDVRMCIRSIQSANTTELYFSVSPTDAKQSSEQALAAMYGAITEELRKHDAQIFSERIIVNDDVDADAVQSARGDVVSDLVPPTVLHATSPNHHSISGLQVHAIVSDSELTSIMYDNQPVGRRLTIQDRSWVHLGALTAPSTQSPQEQTQTVFRNAQEILATMNMSFHHVARTWVWLRDILNWYDEFNDARTDLFVELSLVNSNGVVSYLPASTGIGVAPANNSTIGLELFAISDGTETIENFMHVKDQPSAFSYGSAFARACTAPTPAGSTLFISGTAAIDDQGITEHQDDAKAQIEATIHHIRAILNEANVNDDEVLSAIVYAKNPVIAKCFQEHFSNLTWPCIETVAAVCRDDLLFEIELTAAIMKQ